MCCASKLLQSRGMLQRVGALPPSRELPRRTRSSTFTVGAWRSLVAHTLGVRVVAGSNPAAPTNPTVLPFPLVQLICADFCPSHTRAIAA